MSELERLRDRVEQLEEALGVSLRLPNEYGLTPLEMKIIGLLVRRGVVGRETIYSVVYGSVLECDQPDPKVIDVHLCKMRRKLRPHGLEIKTHRNVGFYLSREDIETFKRLCGVGSTFTIADHSVPA